MLQFVTYYGALGLEALLGVVGIRLYEEPRYEVIGRIADRVEIRRYAPRLAAEVQVLIAGEAGRNEAFSLLFAYLAGANQTRAGSNRMAMTAPVSVRNKERVTMTVPVLSAEASGSVRMQFFLPAKYDRDNAPSPLDARVRLVTIPEETIAVLRFSGSGGDVTERQSEVIARLSGSRWQPTGPTFVLFYDAPFTLPFVRRNEAAVAVVESQ